MGNEASSAPKDKASLQQETGSSHAATQQSEPNKKARREGHTAPVVGPPQLSDQAAAACAAGQGLRCRHAELVAGMAAGMATWPDIFKPDQPAKAHLKAADRGSNAICRLPLEFLVSVHAQEALALSSCL